jgi:hypothetical protein
MRTITVQLVLTVTLLLVNHQAWRNQSKMSADRFQAEVALN